MEKTYVISVSAGTGCYRHIQISNRETLHTLHLAILEAFGFQENERHAFFMDNRLNSIEEAYFGNDPQAKKPLTGFPPERDTRNVTLEETGLFLKMKFKYLFDFEIQHRFQCQVLREVQQDAPHPFVVRAVGESPAQEPWETGDVDEYGFPVRYRERTIQRMLETLPMEPETVQTLRAYFAAANRLYAVIPLRKLLEIFNSQNQPVSRENFLAFAEIMRHAPEKYVILGEEVLLEEGAVSAPIDRKLVHESLVEFGLDDYDAFAGQQAGKPYYVPTRKEILRYGEDDAYYPATPQRAAMERFLLKHRLTREETETLMLEMLDLIILGARMDEVVEQAGLMGLRLNSERDVEEFSRLFYELNNTTRMPVNRGNTPEELHRQKIAQTNRQTEILNFPKNGPAPAPKKIKVGRNDPCPCGSGKKYKKCCGR